MFGKIHDFDGSLHNKDFRLKERGRDATESLRRTIKLSVYSAINSQVLTISTTDLLNQTKWWELQNIFGQILGRHGSHSLDMGFKESDCAVSTSVGGVRVEQGYASHCKPFIQFV